MKDHKYVNFSEDEYYELNEHLEKVGKRQTKSNRDVLRVIGKELKIAKLTDDELESLTEEKLKVRLSKIYLTHKEFDDYILDNLDILE